MSEQPEHRRMPPPPPAPLPPPRHPGSLDTRPQGWQAPPNHTNSYPQPYGGQPGPGGQAGPRGQPGPGGQPYAPPAQQGWPPTGPPPQWGYGGYGAPPPPRRSKGSASRVLLGLVMVVSAAVFVLVLLSAFVSGGESDAFVREAGSGAPADPSDPGAQPVDPDDFQAVMEDNTLYTQGGLRQRDCVATDLDDADTGDQERYYSRLMGCLDEEWGTLIESAGYAYDTPQLVVFDDEIATPCGNAAPRDGRTLAFYCPTDAVLYADAPQMARFFGEIEMAYAVVIGHEFGHHVQNEVGILVAYDDAVYARFSDRFELSRRVELQASCMSGLFLGAVAATYPISETDFSDLQQVSLSFGDETGAQEDERDHGSGQSNQEWILTAFDTNDTAVCNTFAAPDGAVD